MTEDSNSEDQFFDAVCTEHQMQCDTANGKSNVFSYLKVHRDEKILVIADGAAFGPEMDRVMQLVQTRKNLALYLPESFEWLILSSGILKDAEVAQILQTPSDYIDSKEYFSWERYFTALLTAKTAGTYLNYTKKMLNEAYLNDGTKNSLKSCVKKHIKATANFSLSAEGVLQK